MFTYCWTGLDLVTGVIFSSPGHYHDLESVERSIAKHLSNRDSDDYVFEVIKIDNRGRGSLLYTKMERDLGEGVGIDEWYRFLNLSKGATMDIDAEKVDALLKKIKRDDIIESVNVQGLDPLQELRLANMVYKIKERQK